MPPAESEIRDERLCGRVAHRMSGYLDGELKAGAAWTVAVHLSHCANCARFAEELAAAVAALHRLGARSRLTLGQCAGPGFGGPVPHPLRRGQPRPPTVRCDRS